MKLFGNKKLLFGIIAIIIVVVAAFFFLQQRNSTTQTISDDSETRLYFDPSSGDFNSDSSFQVSVNIDTRGRNVTGVKTVISYDTSRLTLDKVNKAGSAFGEDNLTVNANFEGNKIVILADKPEDNPVTGDGKKIATIHFNTTGNGAASVSFTTGTQVETVVNGTSTQLSVEQSNASYTIGTTQTTPTTTQTTPTTGVNPSPTQTPPVNCPQKVNGDANCDGKTDREDLSIFLEEYHNPQTVQPNRADFSSGGIGENIVNLFDFALWRDGCRKGANGNTCVN